MKEEKQLLFKALCMYLPYELEFKRNGRFTSNYLTGLDTDCILNEYDNDVIKLLLLPLSALTEEIEHNGERFVPKDGINDIQIKVDQVSTFDYNSGNFYFNSKCLGKYAMPFWVIEKLLEWHFDIFNLIPKNLAIDKRTIK